MPDNPTYPGYAYSGSPGYSYAGVPPSYGSALSGGFTSAISDFAQLRQQAEMRAYEETRRYHQMSLGRAALMSMGMYTEGVPGGRQYAQEYFNERMGLMGQTAGIYGGALALGGGMMWAAGKMGVGNPIPGMASKAALGIFGKNAVGFGAARVAGVAGSLFGTGLPIMAATEMAQKMIEFSADKYSTMNDIRSMSQRMQPTGFGDKNQIGTYAGSQNIASYVTKMSRTNAFFGNEEMMGINKMGLATGLLKGQSTTEYKRNFDQLVSAAKDMVKLLNTTVEGGMSIMSQVKNNIGLTKVSDIRNYIVRSAQMGALSGYGAENMMMFGQQGAQQVRGTGLSGQFGATMMQNAVVQARQMLTVNPGLQQSYFDLGGAAGVGQTMMRTNANVLNSNMGKMAIASVWDPKTGTINQTKLQALANGKMTAGRIASAGTGWGQADLFTFDLKAPMILNKLGAEKSRQMAMGVFEAFTSQFGGLTKTPEGRRAAAMKFSEMFSGTPQGQTLMAGANFSSIDVMTNYFAEGMNGPTSKMEAYKAKEIERQRAIGVNVVQMDQGEGPLGFLARGWRNMSYYGSSVIAGLADQKTGYASGVGYGAGYTQSRAYRTAMASKGNAFEARDQKQEALSNKFYGELKASDQTKFKTLAVRALATGVSNQAMDRSLEDILFNAGTRGGFQYKSATPEDEQLAKEASTLFGKKMTMRQVMNTLGSSSRASGEADRLAGDMEAAEKVRVRIKGKTGSDIAGSVGSAYRTKGIGNIMTLIDRVNAGESNFKYNQIKALETLSYSLETKDLSASSEKYLNDFRSKWKDMKNTRGVGLDAVTARYRTDLSKRDEDLDKFITTAGKGTKNAAVYGGAVAEFVNKYRQDIKEGTASGKDYEDRLGLFLKDQIAGGKIKESDRNGIIAAVQNGFTQKTAEDYETSHAQAAVAVEKQYAKKTFGTSAELVTKYASLSKEDREVTGQKMIDTFYKEHKDINRLSKDTIETDVTQMQQYRTDQLNSAEKKKASDAAVLSKPGAVGGFDDNDKTNLKTIAENTMVMAGKASGGSATGWPYGGNE